MSETVEFGTPVKFKIMGREYEGRYGEGLLDTLRKYGYVVPSLCHHEAVSAYGACRVCLVEVVDKRGRKKVTTSCNYPVQEGVDIHLDTPEVVKHRSMALEMLLAMAPKSEPLREFAAEWGVEKTRLPLTNPEGDCILCGLCERVCREVVGQNALGMIGRGYGKDVGPAYMEASDDCVACGACAYVCPTACIHVIDEGQTRTIDKWKRTLPMQVCEKTGRLYTPRYLLEKMGEKLGGIDAKVIAKAPPYR